MRGAPRAGGAAVAGATVAVGRNVAPSSVAYARRMLERVRLHDAGGRSLLGVHRELDRRAARPHERRLEVVRDRQHHRHVAAQQRLVAESGDADCPMIRKWPDAPNRVDQPARRARVVEVDDVDRRVADLEGGGVRQDQQLQDRQHQHLRQRRPVAHDVQHFGPREEQDAAHRLRPAARGTTRVLSVSSTSAIAHEHERLPPEIVEADAFEHDAARDEHEPSRRHDVRDARSGHGMLSIGKMNPDSSIVGSIVPTIAPIMATRCDEVRAETRMPSDSDTRMKSRPSASSSDRLPRSGTLNTSRASRITPTTLTKPTAR